ncbi:alpha-2-macroglobulin family protein [Archangium lansingense]|uniref:alpha-2-macroglobulin family protein n=1 Tax=Archangium lansingense TaxID=2995310 RepID=UPI003B774E03
MEDSRLRLLFAVLLLLAAPDASARGRFYLSTQTVTAPGQQPEVNIEASGVRALSMRVYRIPDPEAFMLGQTDLHRPVTQNTLRDKHLFTVLTGGYRAAATSLREQVRDAVSPRARASALEVLEKANTGLTKAQTAPAREQVRIPLLKDYPLVSYWQQDLDASASNAQEAESSGEDGEEYSGNSGSWMLRSLDLGVKESGVYLVEGVTGEDVGYTLAVVSRIGLMVKQGPEQTVALAVDQTTGAALSGVKVTLFDQGKPYAEGTTGSDGLFVAKVKAATQTLALARQGEDVALADASFYSAGANDRVVYLFTDRPVYRPGHEVHFKGIIRSRSGTAYAPPKGGEASVSLVDPSGTAVDTLDAEVSANGSFTGRFELPDKALQPAAGVWRIRAEVEGESFEGEFKLKEFTKPEYQVNVQLERPSYVEGDEVSGRVLARFFHGGVLKNADVQLTVYRSRFFIPDFVDAEADFFVSEGERASAGREIVQELSGTLDANGSFPFKFATAKDGQDYTYSIEAKVVDGSGKTARGQKAVDVTVGRFFLSARTNKLVYEPGDEVSLQVVARDYGEKPVAVPVDVAITYQTRTGASVSEASIPEQKLQVAASATGGTHKLKPTEPGAYLAELTATDDAGSVITTTVPFFVTEKGGDIPMAKGGLELYSDKPSYKVGDEAVVLVRAPFDSASVLLTHEGIEVLSSEALELKGYSAVLRFKVTKEMSPNMYVGAMAISAGRTFRQELLLRVPPTERVLKVEVAADKEKYAPGDTGTFTVSVTSPDGKPVANADIALSVVDEAIYAVSPEIAPSLPEFFFHPVRDNVRGTSSTTFRFYGYGRNVLEQMSALPRSRAGYGDLKTLSRKVRKEFKDTLLFSPNLATGPDGKASMKVTFPDNLTTWRATARVITADTSVGFGVGKARVHQDFQVRLATPRFFRERDTLKLGVLLENSTSQKGTATVTLEATGVELTEKQKTVTVDGNDQAVAVFPVRVTGGDGKVKLRASGKFGTHSDSMELEVPRLAHGAVLSEAFVASLAADSTAPVDLALEIPASAHPEASRLALYASTGIAPAIESALDYLVGYPYGCTEQTMSRFVPNLVAVKAYEQLKLPRKERHGELPKMVMAGVARLRQLQHGDGGWGWWEEDETDAAMTGYVVQGLAMARSLGYGNEEVDQMLTRGLARLSSLSTGQMDDGLRARLLYNLAVAGKSSDSMLTALSQKVREQSELSAYTKSLVVLALAESGKKEDAAALAEELERSANRVGELVVFGGSSADPWWQGRIQPAMATWDGDPIESTASALRALARTRPSSPFIDGAVKFLLQQRRDGHWQSTRDTAVVVSALADVLPRFASQTQGATVAALLDGQPLGERTYTGEDLYGPEVMVGESLTVKPGAHSIQVSRRGEGAGLMLEARLSYVDAGEGLKASSSGLTINRRYHRVVRQQGGGGLEETLQPLGKSAEQDGLLFVELEVTAPNAVEYVMLEDPLCSGCEVEEADVGRKPGGRDLHPKGLHREVRDEKVVFFASDLKAGKNVFGYMMAPGLAGNLHVMPASASLMYHPQVRGTSNEQTLQVGGEP